jgi:hypothetical protein
MIVRPDSADLAAAVIVPLPPPPHDNAHDINGYVPTKASQFLNGTCYPNVTCSPNQKPNGQLDTDSGGQHLSHSVCCDDLYFRDTYSTSSVYSLPAVPYNGEIGAWISSPTATNPNMFLYRFGLNWSSGANGNGNGFFSTPRGGLRRMVNGSCLQAIC